MTNTVDLSVTLSNFTIPKIESADSFIVDEKSTNCVFLVCYERISGSNFEKKCVFLVGYEGIFFCVFLIYYENPKPDFGFCVQLTEDQVFFSPFSTDSIQDDLVFEFYSG